METGRPQSIGRVVTMYGAGTSGVDDPARGKLHGDSADKVVAVRDLCEISDQASGLVPVSAKRNLYYSVDMRDDVLVGFNPGNGLACNRLHTPGNRLHTPGNRLHTPGNRLHTPGNRLHTPGNRLHTPGNRLHTPGNRLHTPGNRLHTPGNRLHTPVKNCELDLPDVVWSITLDLPDVVWSITLDLPDVVWSITLDLPDVCNKCGRLHYGSTCPGKGNECFHCKEFEHNKRYCSKLDRRPNATPAEEARDHGQMVTPSGAGTSGVDDPARGKRMVTGIPCLVLLIRERHTPLYVINVKIG
ncbi:hypothetical protein Lal_00036807 [Lupinus albus]|nr:hypothetical protein Lal_00036807 [Lupinus albus]